MTRRGLTGRHVLLIFAAFFLTIIGVNALMVTFAIGTFSGEDVKGAYVKGLDYNRTLEKRAAEAASGYAATVEGARRADGVVRLEAHLTLNGAAADGAAVEALVRHPANAHLDRTVTLTAAGDGLYAAEIADLPAGRWDAEITVSRAGAEVLQERVRLWLP